MENRIHVQVVTAERVVFDDWVRHVQFPLSDGTVGILHGHAPMLGAMEIGVVKCQRADGTQEVIAVGQGVAHVTGDEVVLLARTAELAANIDLARAQAAERRARQRLAHREDGVDALRAEAALHRALARQAASRAAGR